MTTNNPNEILVKILPRLKPETVQKLANYFMATIQAGRELSDEEIETYLDNEASSDIGMNINLEMNKN